MKKSWYYRMLLSYLPIFFLISSFLFFIFFQELSSQSKKNAVKANQALNLMVIDKVENVLNDIDYAIINFSLNNKILNHFFRDTNKDDLVVNLEMLKEIKELKRQNPLIDTIYLVRNHDQIVLTEKYMFELEEFPDYAYIQEVKENKFGVKWTSPRDYKEFDQYPTKRVITLARSFYTPTGEQCLIVALVNTDSVRSLVEQIYDPELSFVTIEGADGSPIFDNVSDLDDRVVLADNKSVYLEWTFRTGLVNGAFINELFAVSRIWVLLGFIVIILGVVSIIYVTGRNYRPLENVVSKLQSLMSDKNDQSMMLASDEFMLIESAIENMLKKTNKIEIHQENEITLRKKHYFYEIIEGVHQVSDEEWSAEMVKYHLPTLFKGAQVLSIEIDNFHLFCCNFSRRDQTLLKFAISNMVNEIFNNHTLSILSEWVSGKRLTCIVLSTEEGDLQRVHSTADEIISSIKQYMSFTVTIGLGTPVQEVYEISESYKETLIALKYKMLKGTSLVISVSEMEARQKAELFHYIHAIYPIVNDFRSGDAGWSEKLKQMIADIRTDELESDNIISLLNYLIYQLDRAISEISPEYQKPWKELGMNSLTEVLESVETLEEIEYYFFGILNEISEGIAQAHSVKTHHLLLHEVREYIKENFAEPDLSLDRLNEQFGLNAKYLSQLFKDRFGVGFMDFLIKLRIQRAQQLLKETSDPIQTISEKVGYTNVISFTRAFKKIAGQTPGDFRKN